MDDMPAVFWVILMAILLPLSWAVGSTVSQTNVQLDVCAVTQPTSTNVLTCRQLPYKRFLSTLAEQQDSRYE